MDNPHFFKLRILLSFYKMSKESCTVTSLSKTLCVPKYTVSRIISALETDGDLIKSFMRIYTLTEQGKQKAEYYSERIDLAVDHLVYEGVPEEQAKLDAFYITKYCSEGTFKAIRQMETKNKLKLIFKNCKSFTGDTLCKYLPDDSYKLDFVVYRDKFENGESISMANQGFEHPCVLIVKDGKGIINLKSLMMTRTSKLSGLTLTGKISCLKYFYDNKFVDAEISGNIISFPVDALKFISVNNGASCTLHGSVYFKISCSVGAAHMPESLALFAVVI